MKSELKESSKLFKRHPLLSGGEGMGTTPKMLALKELQKIPGVGKSIANDLWNIGITHISDLLDRVPEELYDQSNRQVGVVQDRCLLYVFRCAVYFASNTNHEKEKLKWWNWKDS